MNLKRILALSSLALILGFGMGFLIGQAEDQVLEKWGLISAPTTILIEDSELFTEDLEILFKNKTGHRLKVLKAKSFADFKSFSTEAQIWIARICWLDRISELYPTPSLIHESWAEKNISPDFITFKHQETPFTPLLWSIGDSLHVNQIEAGENINNKKKLPLFLIGIKALADSKAQEVVKELTSRSWIQTWIETVPYATTYMTLDESLLEKYQKASFIRSLEFQKIELVTADSDSCDFSLTDK